MQLRLPDLVDKAFDQAQENKSKNIANIHTGVTYNNVEYNIGAYNADQKDLFINVFNILTCYNEVDIEDELLLILNLLNDEVNEDRLDHTRLYQIYNNAIDVAIQNRIAYGQEPMKKTDVFWSNDDMFCRLLDSTRIVKSLVK